VYLCENLYKYRESSVVKTHSIGFLSAVKTSLLSLRPKLKLPFI